MKTIECNRYFDFIAKEMSANVTKLIELDQAFGDGDLAISMNQGFSGIVYYLANNDIDDDFGQYFMRIAKVFNETAPSSLGTILSFGFSGMAKSLKGISDAQLDDFKYAFANGLQNIKTKAGAKCEEKTIIDSLEPAILEFCLHDDIKIALTKARDAAEKGMLDTKKYIAVHGRASYHNEKTLGHIDGGAAVGYLIFKALANCK